MTCVITTFLKNYFQEEKIDIVFHAAAYKHVPMVENNPISGIKNNVFSTFAIVNACHDVGLEKFILISTDKAVRPSNVMGASKRLSEQIVQAFASTEKKHTKYAMVRFGNVLGSSGSVVPLFEKQIKNGGTNNSYSSRSNKVFYDYKGSSTSCFICISNG